MPSLIHKSLNLLVLLTGIMIFFAFFLSYPVYADQGESLIIFIQNVNSPVNAVFKEKSLPKILKMAGEMNIPVKVDSLKKGAPPEVGVTPLIIYQNHLGRSIYQGRSTTIDRIRNFIRTSRRIPQGKDGQLMTNTPILNMGRSVIYSPLKVSELGGTRPLKYDEKSYQKECMASIISGFTSYKVKPRIVLKRSDRGFYMDFYPWRGDDGTLYISLSLFSQFHCKKPVFELKDKKITGPWEQRHELFKQAGVLMEAEVKKRIQDPDGGDGFDAVNLNTPVKSWESLGYKLPKLSKTKQKEPTKKITLPTGIWHIKETGSGDDPFIQFHFPAPLDNYTGEFKHVTGQLNISGNMTVSEMKGQVKAMSDSVTMGEADLDKTIKGTLFLDLDNHPYSEFVLISASGSENKLSFGQMTRANITGTFSLKGKKIPLSLPIEMEPILDEKDAPQILVRGSFPIDLRMYNIEGATGPEPQKYTLIVELNLIFVP